MQSCVKNDPHHLGQSETETLVKIQYFQLEAEQQCLAMVAQSEAPQCAATHHPVRLRQVPLGRVWAGCPRQQTGTDEGLCDTLRLVPSFAPQKSRGENPEASGRVQLIIATDTKVNRQRKQD